MSVNIPKKCTFYNMKTSDSDFNFEYLESLFSKYCLDYMSGGEMASDFSGSEFFGPGRKHRNKILLKRDAYWGYKYVFCYKSAEDETAIPKKVVIVTKYKPDIGKFTEESDHLLLSLEQSMMLATNIIMRHNIRVNSAHNKLVPRVCENFNSKKSIQCIAADLSMQYKDVINMLCASSCKGGEHFENSSAAAAKILVTTATTGIKDSKIRSSIINKTMEQYHAKGKQFNQREFEVLSIYNEEVRMPDLEAEHLVNIFDDPRLEGFNKIMEDKFIQQLSKEGTLQFYEKLLMRIKLYKS